MFQTHLSIRFAQNFYNKHLIIRVSLHEWFVITPGQNSYRIRWYLIKPISNKVKSRLLILQCRVVGWRNCANYYA